jgi:hypothetical protein
MHVHRRATKRGREKLHYLNPLPIHEIAERWMSELKRGLESRDE